MNWLAGFVPATVVAIIGVMVWHRDKTQLRTIDGRPIPDNVKVEDITSTIGQWAPGESMWEGEMVMYSYHIWDAYGSLMRYDMVNHRYFILTNKRFIKVTDGIIETSIRLNNTKVWTATSLTMGSHGLLMFTIENKDGEVTTKQVDMHYENAAIFFADEMRKFNQPLPALLRSSL